MTGVLICRSAQFLQSNRQNVYLGEFVDGNAVKTDGRGEGGTVVLAVVFQRTRVCVCVRAVVCVVCVRGVLRYLCLETSASAHACVYVRACVRVYVPFNSQ